MALNVSPLFLVPRVHDNNAILDETMTLSRLMLAMPDDVHILTWLAQRRLIANSCNCQICGSPCVLARYSESKDGWRWRCRNDGYRNTIRTNSFFQRSNLNLRTIVIIMYMWSMDFPQKTMATESEVSANTVSDWCNFLREVCTQYIEQNPIQLGGVDETWTPKEVEIDESHFYPRKYHRGTVRRSHWVFGAIERGSKNCLLIEVPDRKRETLVPIIRQWILPGTRIISDGWSAYATVADIDFSIYSHDVVVHERNFVEPNDATINTQLIENTWMRAKKKLSRQFGTSRALFTSYLNEFMWRERVGPNKFCELICCIASIYSV